MSDKAKRVRRTAEEARRVILDAAERRLEEYGPEGIRLQDIAGDVGISHPTILHHFESREGLVIALTQRAISQLRADVFTAFSKPHSPDADMLPILNRVFDVLSRKGHARLIGWMILSDMFPAVPEPGLLHELTDIIHDLRITAFAAHNLPAPTREDTLFLVMLGAITAFGDGLFGPLVRRGAKAEDDPAVSDRFRAWFAELLRTMIVPTAH